MVALIEMPFGEQTDAGSRHHITCGCSLVPSGKDDRTICVGHKWVDSAEVAEWIEVPLGCWTHVGRRSCLPTADTVVHNSCVLIVSHCSLSCSQIIQWFTDIAVW